MKIGLVIYGSLDTLSGGYLYDRKLVEYLRAQGEEVEIFSLPWRSYAACLLDNVHFRLPPGLDLLIQDELNHPSLILANRRPHLYPVISLVHHLRSSEQHPCWLKGFYRFVEERYLRSVDGLIFNSENTRTVVEEMLGWKKSHLVAYPPTDRFGDGFSKREVKNRTGNSGELRLLFIGNLIPRKGLHTLLDAIRDVSFVFHLDVVGSLEVDPPYAQKMQQFAADPNFTSKVTFHGTLRDEPLVALLRSAHLLVVPSSFEGFGIVYLEGMAFGLPAVGTTAGGAVEIIEDGKTGFLIAPGDSETLADRLVLLAHDRALLGQMSLNALNRYRRQPLWIETAGKIHSYLKKQVASFDGQVSKVRKED
jgi:glycosyltransferase involved in cell wall biosynthesis